MKDAFHVSVFSAISCDVDPDGSMTGGRLYHSQCRVFFSWGDTPPHRDQVKARAPQTRQFRRIFDAVVPLFLSLSPQLFVYLPEVV